jgi:hypothetical protein
VRDVTLQASRKDPNMRQNCMYNDYYRTQVLQRGGFDMPHFAGARYQRGHGLGSIFGSIFRGLKSIFPGVLKKVGRHALTTGVNIANDLLEGKNIKEAAKTHGLRGLKSAAGDVVPEIVETIKQSARSGMDQSGSGSRKRKRSNNNNKNTNKRRRTRDIFN